MIKIIVLWIVLRLLFMVLWFSVLIINNLSLWSAIILYVCNLEYIPGLSYQILDPIALNALDYSLFIFICMARHFRYCKFGCQALNFCSSSDHTLKVKVVKWCYVMCWYYPTYVCVLLKILRFSKNIKPRILLKQWQWVVSFWLVLTASAQSCKMKTSIKSNVHLILFIKWVCVCWIFVCHELIYHISLLHSFACNWIVYPSF